MKAIKSREELLRYFHRFLLDALCNIVGDSLYIILNRIIEEAPISKEKVLTVRYRMLGTEKYACLDLKKLGFKEPVPIDKEDVRKTAVCTFRTFEDVLGEEGVSVLAKTVARFILSKDKTLIEDYFKSGHIKVEVRREGNDIVVKVQDIGFNPIFYAYLLAYIESDLQEVRLKEYKKEDEYVYRFQIIPRVFSRALVGPAGFEPATTGLRAPRSTRLSYGPDRTLYSLFIKFRVYIRFPPRSLHILFISSARLSLNRARPFILTYGVYTSLPSILFKRLKWRSHDTILGPNASYFNAFNMGKRTLFTSESMMSLSILILTVS